MPDNPALTPPEQANHVGRESRELLTLPTPLPLPACSDTNFEARVLKVFVLAISLTTPIKGFNLAQLQKVMTAGNTGEGAQQVNDVTTGERPTLCFWFCHFSYQNLKQTT